MESNSQVSNRPGNTPIKNIPCDYYPDEDGHWFTLSHGRDAGKKMFFRDSLHGNTFPEKTIVFIHGNPECSYTYRKTIQNVKVKAKKPFRMIAVDHIGYGLSDQASYEMVCMDHAENLFQLIKYLDLRNVTLIVHDWGGPIGIGAFLKEPERLSSLIILNTTIFPLPKIGLTYNNYPISWLSWSKVPFIIPNRFWGAFASYAIFTHPSSSWRLLLNMIRHIALAILGIDYGLEKTAKRIFREQFRSKMNVRSSKRLVLQTKCFAYGNIYKEPKMGKRDTTPFYKFIQSNLKKYWSEKGKNISVRAILGRWDPLAKNEVIKQWISHLPQLKGYIKVFKNVGHFIEEVKSMIIADAVLEVTDIN
jgi:pimeloyl-ACP methyl ester carboxylesterase